VLGSFRDAAASQRVIGDTMRMLTQLTQIFSAAVSPILALGSFRADRRDPPQPGTAGDAGLRLLGLQRWAI